jgi:quercetin 2,3-dioxygenase
MKHQLFKVTERGVKDLGWLQSNFNFSFSSYANPLRNGFGLLKVFNDDFVAAGKGFGLHPHQNMEIISVMIDGKMNHKDNMGYSEVVEKDWVQIMSAGTGLRHEENNVGDETVNFLQIWIEPKLQNITPRYQKRYFPKENRINTLTTIVSNQEGTQHCWINQNAQISLGAFNTQSSYKYTLSQTNKCVFIFNIKGKLNIAGTDILEKDAIGLWETDKIYLHIEPNSEFIVIEVPINH